MNLNCLLTSACNSADSRATFVGFRTHRSCLRSASTIVQFVGDGHASESSETLWTRHTRPCRVGYRSEGGEEKKKMFFQTKSIRPKRSPSGASWWGIVIFYYILSLSRRTPAIARSSSREPGTKSDSELPR